MPVRAVSIFDRNNLLVLHLDMRMLVQCTGWVICFDIARRFDAPVILRVNGGNKRLQGIE
jgi:hypothetical protein